MHRIDMCKDDSDIMKLSFENRCECKACPGEIQRAIMSFDGVKEMKNMDYKKGTVEVIVTSKLAEDPQELFDWILYKAKKHAKIADCTTEPSHKKKDDEGIVCEETIRYREYKEWEIRGTAWWK